LFVLTGCTLLAFYVFARWLVRSKYGRVLQAIRDAETRVMFSGYNPLGYKLTIWVISAIMCGIAGVIFVVMFTLTQNKWKIDDVLGVWPLHGLCGTWGGVAAGIFGSQALGGLGGVSLQAQLIGTALGVAWALAGGFVVYGLLKMTVGLRMSQEEEFDGADLSTHKISASPERESNW